MAWLLLALMTACATVEKMHRFSLDNQGSEMIATGSCPASLGYSNEFLVRSGGGLIRDSSLNLTEVFWIGPECMHVFAGSPAVVQAPNGELLVSHDFFGGTTMNDTVQVASSSDNGATWRLLSNVTGMYWANMFVNNGVTYMFGTAGDDIHKISPPNKTPMKGGPVVIASSTDSGKTWSTPVVILPGSFQTAPTPMVLVNGTLYRTMEDSSVAKAPGAFLMWADESSDLSDAKSWHRSSSISAPLSHTGKAVDWQEGSAIEAPDGRIANLLRINGQNEGFSNVAGLTYLEGDELVFDKYVNGPFSTSKFLVRRDPNSTNAVYFALSTNTTAAAAAVGDYGARNNLVLSKSIDLVTWHVCSTVLSDDTGLAFLDSNKYTGFEYPDFVFDGADMVAAIRTAYRGAAGDGSSNRITFKRLSNFRDMC